MRSRLEIASCLASEVDQPPERRVFSHMGNVVQTKQFIVHHSKGRFELFISAHDDGYFYGTLLYHETSGDFSAGTREMAFKHQNFVGNSEEDVLVKGKAWIDQNLGREYTLTPSAGQQAEPSLR